MTVAERICSKLTAALAPSRLVIHDDSHLHQGHFHSDLHPGGETHFRLEIVAEAFAGQSRLARQRRVYAILAEELAGQVHALQLTIQTPGEAHLTPG